VDPVGVRTILAAGKIAKQKGLSVVAGTQRRHQNHYVDILKRVRDGAIGEIVAGQCYWNMTLPWDQFKVARTADMSDMEWQCRNWFYTTWLSGDHICEQHVHNLDIMNWGIGAHPVQVMGVGGRQALKWSWAMNASKLDLRPDKYEFGDLPLRPVAIPGKTPLV
ncbi:MAG: hypothetical protein JSW59_11085, partial [Phycisphaerales bacterium]